MLPDFNSLKTQFMLPQFINAGCELLLNYLLRRTSHRERYLRQLQGKILKLTLQKTHFSLYFVFSAQQVDLLNHYEGEADCTVDIAVNLLLQMPKKSEISRFINDNSLQFSGDLQILQDFVELMEMLEKDPAELISPYVGDVIAHSAVSFLKNLTESIKYRLTQSQQFWAERLTEEWTVLSSKLAVMDFCDQVESLAKQTALLEQKINQILA
ncbi:ubiquinone biosynthesis accessory factor UbiJ [Histophilus somni]|uniref:ubiquinone biosynthesis accessory factor UbiJ n=1 Tax=Histophilus somni TaxID=731 RepID=UPI00003974DA|nr:SCP2 domain-containing protein [Histophilus somni]ACA31425.1 protein of unknown function DUF1243 [Histophilus somni 2336]QQF85419.1 SCP2 domain-containing protein [Histophilus somni]QQJ90769.1 SCP2 domain-containing protein [Histophilus somni]